MGLLTVLVKANRIITNENGALISSASPGTSTVVIHLSCYKHFSAANVGAETHFTDTTSVPLSYTFWNSSYVSSGDTTFAPPEITHIRQLSPSQMESTVSVVSSTDNISSFHMSLIQGSCNNQLTPKFLCWNAVYLP